jgi:hypothetical protein
MEHDAPAMENGADRIAGLGSIFEPVEGTIFVEAHLGGLAQRKVTANILDVATIPRLALVGGYNRKDRNFFAPNAAQSKLNRHVVVWWVSVRKS